MISQAFKITGMDCAEEIALLKAELGPMPGVQELAFDLLNAKMTVSFDESKLTTAGIVEAVARTGMGAEPWSDSRGAHDSPQGWNRWGRPIMTAASGAFMALGLAVHVAVAGMAEAFGGEEGSHHVPLVARALFLLAVVSGGWFVAPKGWAALRRFRPDMNLLMVIAVAGAIGIGEWFEAAAVCFLFAVSLLLESWSVGRARRAVAALMTLAEPQARILREDGTEEEIAAEKAAVGSKIVVRPGERFPLDGKIAKGESAVNQAPITGESVPVSKAPGDDVFAGTINGDGAVEVVTTKLAGDTTLARIIRMVGEAQSRRSPSEQWVEKFARVYTPAVMALAFTVAVIPPLLFGGEWAKWFYEALVLLVIACPCALVISTPVSIVAALTSAASHGVLIKGGVFMEAPARLKAIAMDKTGTLTEGRPKVCEIVPLSGHSETELIEIAAALEARSEHPLARAIIQYAADRGIAPPPASDFQAIKGKGASATLNGESAWIGSHRYLEERAQETPEMHAKLEELSRTGGSVVVIGTDRHVCGFIAVADRIRANSRESVALLKAAGIEHVVMLTGDNKPTAEAIAREAGVDEVMAELLPEDKVTAIERLVEKYGAVAMVGDGVNDAPALARATIGIAMGAAGTDAALETADVALMSDDLSRLPWLIGHSRRTLGITRQNIGASLGIKAVFVALTFAGMASLWGAIAADMGVSLLVVFNALRLLGGGDERPPTGGTVS